MNEKENSRDIENDFHLVINQYFSGNLFSNLEKFLLFSAFAKTICKKYASNIVNQFKSVHKANTYNREGNVSVIEDIKVNPYTGHNPSVLKLMNYLNMHLKPFLIGAYLHGSLATNEEINYSDFDAVLILRNSAFSDPETLGLACRHILKAKKILIEYDHLQHHSFTILSEFYLNRYCQEHFPLVLFRFSKSLLKDTGLKLSISTKPSGNYGMVVFSGMASAIRRKLENKKIPTNYYDLKLLLSQVMLLPSLYLQAKNQYVFKENSFDLAMKEFDPEDWRIMEKISQIRKDWDFYPSFVSRFLQKKIDNPFLVTAYQKKIGQPLSAKKQGLLNDDFYICIINLIGKMEFSLSEPSNSRL